MFFLMKKMQKDAIVVLNLDFFEFRAINEFDDFFVKKRGLCSVGKICHWCLDKCSNKNVRHFQENKPTSRMGGGFFENTRIDAQCSF